MSDNLWEINNLFLLMFLLKKRPNSWLHIKEIRLSVNDGRLKKLLKVACKSGLIEKKKHKKRRKLVQ